MIKETRYTDLVKIVEELQCDNCSSQMRLDYSSNDSIYHYVCDRCHHRVDAKYKYPRERIVGNKCYEGYVAE